MSRTAAAPDLVVRLADGADLMDVRTLVRVADFLRAAGAEQVGLRIEDVRIHPEGIPFLGYLLETGLRADLVGAWGADLALPPVFRAAAEGGRLSATLWLRGTEAESEPGLGLPGGALRVAWAIDPDAPVGPVVETAVRIGAARGVVAAPTGVDVGGVDRALRPSPPAPLPGERGARAERGRGEGGPAAPPDSTYPVRTSATLVELAEACFGAGLRLEMGPGFRLCAFSDNQLGALFRLGVSLRFEPASELELGPYPRARTTGFRTGAWVPLPRVGRIADVAARSADGSDDALLGLPGCGDCNRRARGTCDGAEAS
jgi:hypothetical protein